MPVRSCRVTIQDMDGVSHTVEVTASTLYEAVAQGLAAIRGNDWVAGIAQGVNVVKVSVADVRVEHEVKLMDFTKWVDRTGGSPREMSDRQRIRSILGMPVVRSTHFVKSISLTSCSTRTSATETLTTLTPCAMPATQSFPRIAARPCATASYSVAAVTSTVCETPSIS